ncbi:MAG: hypothetical protein ABJE95_26645 [Byssovorax sp.]
MRAQRAVVAAALGICAALVAEGEARAGAFEVLGFGPTGVAEVNARAAHAADGTATFYNPGGLAFARGTSIELAPTLGLSALSAQGRAIGLDDPFGISIALALTVPLEGPLKDRIRLGFGGYLLPSGLLHLVARPGETPFYPYYDNRTQRLVVIPALAVRVTDRLGIGLGVNVLGGVSGPAAVQPGASGATESRLDLEATTRASVHAGLRFELAPYARVAFVFRQKFSAPARVTTTAEVAGIPLAVSVGTESALFDPAALVLASSFEVGRASFEIDATWSLWSAYDGPFASVRASLPGLDIASKLPASIARDVVSLRAAASTRIAIGAGADLVLRAGAGAEPSMLKGKAQGRENLIDGDKILGGLGASLVLHDVLSVRSIRAGIGLGTQVVLATSQAKRACAAQPCAADTVAGPDASNPSLGITNPGFPRLDGGGAFWSGSLGIGVDL